MVGKHHGTGIIAGGVLWTGELSEEPGRDWFTPTVIGPDGPARRTQDVDLDAASGGTGERWLAAQQGWRFRAKLTAWVRSWRRFRAKSAVTRCRRR
ncbi:hypothetical protein BJ970_007566 [Saccharopolyspora phatthalungensis]|uniref:Uncharacterized protein n=1 Tax=Saccharopolyspora phatthalungensis TaxID=664693 RepID=A0A840QHH2_9PSEU|nr:hypothetical protein [Saccharopolyspora phatthalungensis]